MFASSETRRRWLVGVETVTGVAAVAGGVLLAVRPDGSLLRADAAALAGSPFDDWRVPGVLLASLVGAGMLTAAAVALGVDDRGAWVSVAAGIGLVLFEVFELAWLGPQPLEAVFALVGAAIAALAWSGIPARRRPGLATRHN